MKTESVVITVFHVSILRSMYKVHWPVHTSSMDLSWMWVGTQHAWQYGLSWLNRRGGGLSLKL